MQDADKETNTKSVLEERARLNKSKQAKSYVTVFCFLIFEGDLLDVVILFPVF